MTVLLSDEEHAIRVALERHLGIDGSGVMRQAMLELARRVGVKAADAQPRPKPRGKSR